jgi:hypothetical protein
VSAGKILVLIVGIVAALLALALLAAGAILLWADRTYREDGYLTTPTERFTTPTYALTKQGIDLDLGRGDWAADPERFGRIRITGESLNGKPIFIGIGPENVVDSYLRGVGHAEVEDLQYDPFEVEYRLVTGAAPPRPPLRERFWVAATGGTGERRLTWDVADGNWSVVVMNGDGSRGVDADLSLGARLSFLIWVAIGLLIAGVLVAIGSALLISLAFRKRPPPAPAPPPAPTESAS